MADTKKKNISLFTHWARPRVRTYEYNYEYGESYYRPLVRYISTSRALAATSSSSSSSVQYESSRTRLERRRRAASPPGPLSFIERWSYEPFYGYGVGFRSRASRASSEQFTSSSSRAMQSSLSSSSRISRQTARSQSVSRDLSVYKTERESRSRERSVSRAQSAARALSVSRAESVARALSVSRAQSVSRSLEQQESSALDIRSRRARSVDIAARYASDDCLMRSNALNSALAASQDILNTSSLTRRTLVLDNQNVLHGRTLDERYYLDYPKQHLVCPPNCPLHNNPEWRRRFLIGNRFLDAAALGGFDVLYDPSVFRNSRRLLSKLSERSEYDTEEVSIQRSSDLESSRRRIRATASMA